MENKTLNNEMERISKILEPFCSENIDKKKPCKSCNPMDNECTYCPYSSVGLINIRDRNGPCEDD